MRDIEVVDSELRLLLSIRRMVREEEGRIPSTVRIDQLLDDGLGHVRCLAARVWCDVVLPGLCVIGGKMVRMLSWVLATVRPGSGASDGKGNS